MTTPTVFSIRLKKGPRLVQLGNIPALKTVFTISANFHERSQVVHLSTRPLTGLLTSGYVTVARARAESGRSVSTIYRWLRKGKIKGIKINGRWWILRESISSKAT